VTALNALADAPWLTEQRIRRVALIFAGLTLVTLAGSAWFHTRAGVTSAAGEYLGADFINYWAGAHLAAHGHAAAAYDIDGFMAWQRAHSASNAQVKWYSYPPTALLLSLPLALFGFKTGLVAWLVAGWGVCFLLLKRILSWPAAMLASFAAPASFINALSGQNGQFSAALLCGGVLLLDSNPLMAGLLFGLLCFKPHLAILVPVALAAGGYWRAFAASAITALAVTAASLLLFGDGAWLAFLHNAPLNTWLMEQNTGLWHRMPTVFAMTRFLGGPVIAAYGLQIVSAIAAIILVIRCWRSAVSTGTKGAVLVLATFVATPYAWDYDLVSLTFAIAWLAADGLKNGFRPWEKSLLAFAGAIPLILSPLGAATHLQIGPLVLWPMLLLAAGVFCKKRSAPEPAPMLHRPA
jgi:hypothetical protein